MSIWHPTVTTCCSSRTANRVSVEAMAAHRVTKTDARLAARCAAVASVGAAVVHVAVAPAHGQAWLLSGVFFAALAIFQLWWAYVAWHHPRPMVLAVGIAASAGAIVLWVMSRSSGAPFGPHAGQPEAVDGAGISVLLLQCYVIMGAVWSWSRSEDAEQVSGFSRSAVLLGANAVAIGAVAVGLVSGLQGHQHHGGGVTEAKELPHHEVTRAPAPVEAGLPVTDMSLDVDAHHHDHG